MTSTGIGGFTMRQKCHVDTITTAQCALQTSFEHEATKHEATVKTG
jgi:hypothetical protein